MARTFIDRVDALASGTAASPIRRGDQDRAAVGAIQDLLAGHGYAMPGLNEAGRGSFGSRTVVAVKAFRAVAGLPPGEEVDGPTLGALVSRPAKDPRASRAYLALALDMEFGGFIKALSLIAQCEGAGRFGAQNRNTDKQGLSFGLLQWAQRQERLVEVATAFRTADPAQFVATLGGGQAAVADGLLAHLGKASGGVDADGHTTDPAYDLVASPWTERFQGAAAVPSFQKAQVATAVAALRKSYVALGKYAPDATSARSVTFMLDLANQRGDGGARKWWLANRRPTPEATIAAIAAADATYHHRRQFFVDTSLLDEAPFVA